MTPRERLVAAARGGAVDTKPVVVWSESPGHTADGVCVSMAGLADAIRTHQDQAVLAEIVSPLGRAMRLGVPLLQILDEDPQKGETEIKVFADEVRRDMDHALELGADGVFYRLDGAYPEATTPMQYGGHFLELDRELLGSVQAARVNLLWIEGESEPYLDFVSDLPAHLMGWNVLQTQVSVAHVRSMRTGALCAADPAADVLFTTSFDVASQFRESHPA